jgi:hypothetical protein
VATLMMAMCAVIFFAGFVMGVLYADRMRALGRPRLWVPPEDLGGQEAIDREWPRRQNFGC